MSILRLAIPTPLRRHFDYLPPADLDPRQVAGLAPGIRVQVPFGPRRVTGYLLQVCSHSDSGAELKQALEIVDQDPLPNPALWQLLQWCCEYYHHPQGEVYSCAFPPRLRKGRPREPLGEPGWLLSQRGRGLPEGALARSPRQAQALALLQGSSDGLSTAALRREGISSAVLRALEDKALVQRVTLASGSAPPICHPGLELNREQATALAGLGARPDSFHCHLLEGVTGSGKTEVYLQLIAACLASGRQALVLIPEIGLTPQTLSRFEQRFDTDIAVFHSGLGEASRYRAWEAARCGTARIVIGTRSAVFTPMPELGLVIIDEEHDSSYKQQDGFRYSARDVAVKRAQLEDCPVVLGSATPSLESLHNALSGRYGHHQLLQRAGSSALPSLEAMDIRRQELRGGLSPGLLAAVDHTLRRGEQVLLFLNRRGYAPSLQCHDCGWVAGCEACDARLTIHRRARRLRCHHCGASHRLPTRCAQCHSSRLLANGLGTEQAEDVLRQQFSNWPVFRVDSDSMQGRDAMQALVDQINRGEACILLGTQMLAKGHHFPAVSLVAVIDADAMLFSADFRGEERMAQLLTQVAGRAGRAELPGRVILQSHYPDHPALQAMLSHSYAHQARELLARRQQAGLPPVGQLLLLRTDCADPDTGEQFLQALRRQLEPRLPSAAGLIGPLPAPMQRRAGMFRHHLLLTTPHRGMAQAMAARLVSAAEALPTRKGLKWSLDVDPQETM